MKTDTLFVSPVRTKQNPIHWNLHLELDELGYSLKNTLATIAETDFCVGYMPSSSV